MRIRAKFLLLAAGLLTIPFLPWQAHLRASDHADTAENFNRPGADLADVFIFPSPTNNDNVVLVMDVHPLIPPGQSPSFDPNVLYQFKMDTTGDYVEDLVIQLRFMGSGANQRAVVVGPSRPYTLGTSAVFGRPYPTTGAINTVFSPTEGMTVFAGVRSDPFFFDLERFFAILPDRATPGTGNQVDFSSILAADTPVVQPDGLSGFRGFPDDANHTSPPFDHSPAGDLLAGLNVLSIVVELPRSALGGGKVNLWETTNVATGAPSFRFIQQDRLARPAVNEALATVTDRRHEANNKINPPQDRGSIGTDIATFMTNPKGANRSSDVANALVKVLTPDVLVADLTNMTDKASYLGVETNGFTGGTFGGRALTDDVIDIDLLAIFGPVIPLLNLAPDDSKELPQFETDNIGPHTDYQIGAPYLPIAFPYLGNPH